MSLNKIVNILLLTTALSGCQIHSNKHHKIESNIYSYEKFGLRVTDSYALGGLSTGNVIQYNGMIPRDSVFFVSAQGSEDAVNQYYSSSAKKIYFFGRELDIWKVTPDSLILGRHR